VEELARAATFGLNIFRESARELLRTSSLCVAPAINLDGLDLVTGALKGGSFFDRAYAISRDYPQVPFPSGWKANILGTDLNLQYPAGWAQAREIKAAQGVTSPSPRDFVGTEPLSSPEARAVYKFTRSYSPSLTLSYHTQGRVIYWKYLDCEPPMSREIAEFFGEMSG